METLNLKLIQKDYNAFGDLTSERIVGYFPDTTRAKAFISSRLIEYGKTFSVSDVDTSSFNDMIVVKADIPSLKNSDVTIIFEWKPVDAMDVLEISKTMLKGVKTDKEAMNVIAELGDTIEAFIRHNRKE